jgi:serine/threonine protein kinase
MPLTPGARLGVYEVLSAVGAGGMGEVYRARDTRLDRIVAIKVLPAEFANDPQFRDRFDREANSVAYDVSPDGQKFLRIQALYPEPPTTQVNVVLNWFEELKNLSPQNR